jgi:hypothetical protein
MGGRKVAVAESVSRKCNFHLKNQGLLKSYYFFVLKGKNMKPDLIYIYILVQGLVVQTKKPEKFSKFWENLLTPANSTDFTNYVPIKGMLNPPAIAIDRRCQLSTLSIHQHCW